MTDVPILLFSCIFPVPFVGCKPTHFHCKQSGLCVHKILQCDGNNNCGNDANGVPDLSDEAGCGESSSHYTLSYLSE